MNCIYCGTAANTHRESNADPQGERLPGWHYECDDSAACFRRVEERRKRAKERVLARGKKLDAIMPHFAETKEFAASPDAETFGNPKLRERQLVRNSTQNHFLLDPPSDARAIWYVDFSGSWGARRNLRAEWTPELEAAIREWAAI
jgi:hypothetical protein